MKRIDTAVLVVVALGISFLFGTLSHGTATAAPRPQNDTALLLQLNGEPRRWLMEDGGWSGMYGSGIQCMKIYSGDTLLLEPSAEIHLCMGQMDGGWDGGCNTTVTDPNYGVTFSTDKYLSTQNKTALICEVPTSGSANVPVFTIK